MLFPLLILLGGCATSELSTAVGRETKAWQQAHIISDKECSEFGDLEDGPKSAKLSMAYYECKSKILKEVVLPSALYPDLILQYDAKSKKIAQDFASGKLSSGRRKDAQKRLSEEVEKAYRERYAQHYAHAHARDEYEKRKFAAGFAAGFAGGSGAYSAPAQPVRAPTMTTVTCKPTFHTKPNESLTCTTW